MISCIIIEHAHSIPGLSLSESDAQEINLSNNGVYSEARRVKRVCMDFNSVVNFASLVPIVIFLIETTFASRKHVPVQTHKCACVFYNQIACDVFRSSAR
jgi:hypothetical protein